MIKAIESILKSTLADRDHLHMNRVQYNADGKRGQWQWQHL